MASGTYEPNAVKFDGSNDYLTRGGDLTGIADSKSGILSFWLRVDYDTGTSQRVISSSASNTRFYVQVASTGDIGIVAANSAGTTILSIKTTTTLNKASSRWIHILASWDLATTTSTIYVNDTADQTVTTRTNDTIDYAVATNNWSIGARGTPDLYVNGAISELYFAPGQYLDFSTESNRRKFIDADGLPVSLGADGSTPTGTAPIIYLKGDYSAFGTNSGTGGNFTVNGALEKASTTPATLPAYNAVDFDGSADYLTRGADLTGLIDGKSGILSCWLRRDGGDGTAQRILANLAGTLRFHLTKDASNKYVVTGINSAGSTILTLTSNTAYTSSPDWVHLLSSWDLAATTGTLYVDSASDLAGGSTLTNDTIDYVTATPNWSVGADTDATDKMFGAISELYFAPNQYLDLSVQANREKFILNGAPVSLGSDGSLPTGTAPAIYLPNRAALVGTNAGSGGNFTINGAPKDANSTPVYYYAEPADFDGSADYLTRGSGLTGAADSATGIFSTWVRFDGGNGVGQSLLQGNSGFFHIFKTTLNYIQFDFYDASIVLKLRMYTSAILASAKWVHILASWTTGGATHLYVDNVSNKTVLTNVSGNIDYTVSDVAVGAQIGGTQKTDGCLADFYFAPGQYLDFSDSANRAKFIDQTTLRPVPLGAKGELPTGSQPLLYLGRDYANFQTNLGSGGNFTVTGALERGTTSPSDVRA